MGLNKKKTTIDITLKVLINKTVDKSYIFLVLIVLVKQNLVGGRVKASLKIVTIRIQFDV